MKKPFIAFVFAAAFAATGAPHAQAAEKEVCLEGEYAPLRNGILQVVSIPFKISAALTYLPRCLVKSIPKNK